MKTKQLGNSDLYITPIGFGAWAIGGSGWEFAWGGQDDSDSIAAIHEALDAGINWIDTAAVYGLGHSEEVGRPRPRRDEQPALRLHQVQHGLGRAAADRPQPQGRLDPPRVRGQPAAAEGGRHRPLPDPLARPGRGHRGGLGDDGQAARKRAKSATSASRTSTSARCGGPAPSPRSRRSSRRYSLIHREVEDEILPFAARKNIGVIAYSPMASGLLTGAMTRERIAGAARRRLAAEPPRLPGAAAVAQPAAGAAAEGHRRPHGRTPAEVAVAWVLRNPAVTGAIVGARKPGQIRGVVGAAGLRFSPTELHEIDAFFAKAAA